MNRVRMVLMLAVLAGLGWLLITLLRPAGDGIGPFPHTYLAEAGYDPAQVTIVRGPISFPVAPPTGLLNAWQCDDPAFNDAQGRPWLFPMSLTSGGSAPTPPLHPTLKRRPTFASCHLYQTAEGRAELDAFRATVAK